MKRWGVVLIAGCLFLASCQKATETPQLSNKEVTVVSTIDWSKAGPDAKKHEISFEQVRKEVESSKAVFLDVRSEEEFAAQNFEITQNYPIAKLKSGELPEISKEAKIYVHCLKGIRSAEATQILREAGFTAVYDMGGIENVEAIGGVLK